jgi:hypothetical protein
MAAWAGRCPSLDVNDKVMLDITFNCVPDPKALIDYAARYYDTPPTDIQSFLEGSPWVSENAFSPPPKSLCFAKWLCCAK